MIILSDIQKYLTTTGKAFVEGPETLIVLKQPGIERNLLFEIGTLVHPKPRNYYVNRSKQVLANGEYYYLLWEDMDLSLALSIVQSKLGLSKRLYARNLTLTTIPRNKAIEFFNENHIDGANKSASTTYAMIDSEGNICCAMSLLNRRIQSRHTSAWEIGRFASAKGITVVGGYSKMLKEAISYLKSQGVSELYSYCDRDISPDPHNTFYSKFGFEYLTESGSIYWYWASQPFMYLGKVRKQRVSRQTVQKQKLLKHFTETDTPLPEPCTEGTLCKALGLVPCYNSGNFKYVFHISQTQEVKSSESDEFLTYQKIEVPFCPPKYILLKVNKKTSDSVTIGTPLSDVNLERELQNVATQYNLPIVRPSNFSSI